MMFKPKSLLHHLFKKNAELVAPSLSEQMNRKLRLWLPMLGWPGILAISLLALCLPWYFSTIRPLQERLDVAQNIAAATRDHALDNQRRGGITLPSDQLTKFYEFFPPEKNSPQWLGKMVEVAEKTGLSLNHGEYAVSRDKVGKLVRIKITLPVQGNYPQLRKFLAALTTEVPFMALENVQFERKDILDSTVQVKLKLLLYLVQES